MRASMLRPPCLRKTLHCRPRLDIYKYVQIEDGIVLLSVVLNIILCWWGGGGGGGGGELAVFPLSPCTRVLDLFHLLLLLQVDNQLPFSVYPQVAYPLPPPPTVASTAGIIVFVYEKEGHL